MTTWTAPKTWGTGELVTAADMNTYIRDNLLYLKGANSLTYAEVNSSYSTTSGSWNDVDSSNLALNVTTSGGLLILGMRGAVRTGNGSTGIETRSQAEFDITRDGNRLGGTHGSMAWFPPQNDYSNPGLIPYVRAFQVLLPSLAAGSYTFRLQWRCYQYNPSGSNTVFLDNSASGGVPVLFYALEVAV
jgi:hypothetical protein